MAHNCFRCTSPSGCSFVSPHSCFFFIDFPWGVCCLDINLIVVSIFWTLLPLMCQLSERGNKLKNLERLWACTIQSPNWSLPTKLVSCSNFVTEMVWNHNWIGNRELGIAEYHLAQWQVTFFFIRYTFPKGSFGLRAWLLYQDSEYLSIFFSGQLSLFGWKSRMSGASCSGITKLSPK